MLTTLLAEIQQCRRCELQGYPIVPPPVVRYRDSDTIPPSPFMLIGQAPSLSDWRTERIYQGPAARKLIGWLIAAGFSEGDIGTTVYMTALTKCFPGRVQGLSKGPCSDTNRTCQLPPVARPRIEACSTARSDPFR